MLAIITRPLDVFDRALPTIRVVVRQPSFFGGSRRRWGAVQQFSQRAEGRNISGVGGRVRW
jgi:hypothetical protein